MNTTKDGKTLEVAEKPITEEEVAQTTEEKPEEEVSPFGPGISANFDLELYEIINKEDYTVENLIYNNTLEGHLQVTPTIQATFRILNTSELQQMEEAAYKEGEKGIYHSMNEMSLRPMIKSIVSMEVGGKKVRYSTAAEEKGVQIRAIPIPVTNELIAAYQWFATRTNILVRGTDLKN